MANISDEELTEEFGSFSIDVDSSDILDKLKRMCQLYRLNGERMVEEWVAFCSSKKLQTKRISLDALEHLERERLSKSMKTISGSRGPNTTLSSTFIHDVDSLEQQFMNSNDGGGMLGAYTTPNGKVLPKKRQHTPEMSANKRVSQIGRSPGLSQSPRAQQSPSTTVNLTPSQRYAARTNAGEVVASYGLVNGASLTPGNGREQPEQPANVKLFDGSKSLKAAYKYMFQKTADKAYVLDDLITDMSQMLKDAHSIEECAHVALPVQDTVSVVGRVCCDGNGKLNPNSVLLEGSRDTSAGRQVALDLSGLTQYSLFPGQIVAVDGTNSSGKRFNASKIHEGVSPPLSSCPTLENGGFSMLIAAGPFTTTDNILNEPLADFIAYLEKGTPPDVCIVFGPFVDVKHPLLEKGDIDTTYDHLFNQLISSLILAAARLKIQLVVVPSTRDIHHTFVYPQPPYSVPKDTPNVVHFVSDPCTLDINGVVVGLTSTDILFHLGAEEISSGQATDRISRLVQHILTQHNYYPLYPPHPDVPVDLDHADLHSRLPVTPHLLILPSDLRCFIKNVGKTVCINPGRMAKGQVGGTFSRIHIKVPTNSSSEDIADSFVEHVEAEIIRI